MKIVKKAIIVLLTVVLITASFAGFKADAKVSQPVIKLKKINNGTGVKIIIEKTHGAEGYFVYMTKRKDAYKNYLYGKGVDTIELGVINKNGKKQREFIINGLPEGKYTFMVEAFMLDQNGDLIRVTAVLMEDGFWELTDQSGQTVGSVRETDGIGFLIFP